MKVCNTLEKKIKLQITYRLTPSCSTAPTLTPRTGKPEKGKCLLLQIENY